MDVPPLSDTAMVLAAGFGTRMRPLTLTTPKPLVEIGGRAMLDLALDRLVAAGVKRAVVNIHYLADQIAASTAQRRDIEIILSHEDELLDTGGGIKHVLPQFGGKAFFALNADMAWLDGTQPSLDLMRQTWRAEMDALLLLMPTAKARGFEAKGDFRLETDGRVHRRDVPPPRSHVWIGAQIVTPQMFDLIPDRVFSNNRVWDLAEQRRRLFGLEHGGTCYHVGTEPDWRCANNLLASGQGWAL